MYATYWSNTDIRLVLIKWLLQLLKCARLYCVIIYYDWHVFSHSCCKGYTVGSREWAQYGLSTHLSCMQLPLNFLLRSKTFACLHFKEGPPSHAMQIGLSLCLAILRMWWDCFYTHHKDSLQYKVLSYRPRCHVICVLCGAQYFYLECPPTCLSLALPMAFYIYY